jgi:O-antigen/teichoic acid export membrane protein
MKLKFKSDFIQSIFAFSVKLGAGIFSYLIFALLAQSMGVEEFGVFSFCFSIIMIIGFSGNYGQQVFLVKQIPVERTKHNKNTELGVYYFSSIITIVASTVGLVCLILLSYYGLVPLSIGESLVAGSLCFLFSLSQTTIGILRVHDMTLFGVFTRDLLWRLLSILIILICVFYKSTIDTYSALLIMGLSLFPLVLWHLIIIFINIKNDFINIIFQINFKEWFNVSSGLALVAIISSVDLYLYTIVLANLVSETDIGAFFVSLKTVELMNLFLMAVTLIIAPKLSSLISQKRFDKLQNKCNEAIILQGIPALIAGIIVIVTAEYFLIFFNPEYASYSSLLRLLVLGMLINAFTGATGLIMQLGGMHWRQVIYQGGSLLLSLLLLIPLVSVFGVIGAGFAFIFSKLLWNFLAIYAIRNRLDVDPSIIGLFTRNSIGLRQSLKNIVNEYK